jgi:carbonic anhydrase
MIDQIIAFNKTFVEQKGYEKYLTSKTVETIKTHPLVPKDVVVRGFIIDSEIGKLEEIKS